MTHFDVKGGLGIWTATENISSRMHWQQRADDFSLSLTAPLGMASIRLDHQDSNATVTRGEVVVARAADPGDALQQALRLAVPVPVLEIAQWLKGQPGAADSAKYDDAGLLESLRYIDQTGTRWDAVIRNRTTFLGARVPALITASGGPYQVRIVLNKWQALNAAELAKTAKPTKNTSQRLAIPTQ